MYLHLAVHHRGQMPIDLPLGLAKRWSSLGPQRKFLKDGLLITRNWWPRSFVMSLAYIHTCHPDGAISSSQSRSCQSPPSAWRAKKPNPIVTRARARFRQLEEELAGETIETNDEHLAQLLPKKQKKMCSCMPSPINRPTPQPTPSQPIDIEDDEEVEGEEEITRSTKYPH